MDEYMRPLYPGVFDVVAPAQDAGYAEAGEPIDAVKWGELEPDEDDDDEDEEDEDGEDSDAEATAPGADGLQTPSGLATPSGLSSIASTVPGGLETPDFIDLRKRREGTESTTPGGGPPRELYTVVQEKRANQTGFLGSERAYDLAGLTAPAPPLLGQEEGRGSKVRLR